MDKIIYIKDKKYHIILIRDKIDKKIIDINLKNI